MSVDFSKFGTGKADVSLGSATAEAWGILLRRPKVELRKQQDIPFVAPNRAERRKMARAVKRAKR